MTSALNISDHTFKHVFEQNFTHWLTRPLVHLSTVSPVHWFTRPLVHSSTGSLVHWFIRPLVHSSTCSLVHTRSSVDSYRGEVRVVVAEVFTQSVDVFSYGFIHLSGSFSCDFVFVSFIIYFTKDKKVRSYVARYSGVRAPQVALRFTRRQTCSIQHQNRLFCEEFSLVAITAQNDSFPYPCTTVYCQVLVYTDE